MYASRRKCAISHSLLSQFNHSPVRRQGSFIIGRTSGGQGPLIVVKTGWLIALRHYQLVSARRVVPVDNSYKVRAGKAMTCCIQAASF